MGHRSGLVRELQSFLGTLALLIAPTSARAQTYSVLHSFNYSDGAAPFAGLVLNGATGTLYGTTSGGGANGLGTVFSVDVSTGAESVLYSFCSQSPCDDGSTPYGELVLNGGNLYGTTYYGGENGYGTIFAVNVSTGAETVLYTFAGSADGANPYAGLIRDSSGNFYGTTESGGSGSGGTVFKLDSSGTETVLYSFCSQTGCTDGADPKAALVLGGSGNLFGTTSSGGVSSCAEGTCGVVFEVSSGGTETVLYSFPGGTKGRFPLSSLILYSGNLYGTTSSAGDATCACGTVFKLDTSGDVLTVGYAFTGTSNSDGSVPTAGVLRDSSGNLYGTTSSGGVDKNDGTVFKLSTNGGETVLHTFDDTDGAYPNGNLVQDASGNLYGTTYLGGAHSKGVVFKLTP